MSTTPEGFQRRINQLRSDIVEQNRRVQTLIERSFEAVFSRDVPEAKRIIELDDVIDRVDVQIERAAVELLCDATREHAVLSDRHVRTVLTVVKINNELERIADLGVTISEVVVGLPRVDQIMPDAFRVMTNSVVGILRDIGASVDRGDPQLARLVLKADETVEAFKRALLTEVQAKIEAGAMTLSHAMFLCDIANQCVVIADHCTNIAEQVIYSTTGSIVRHMETGWVDLPDAPDPPRADPAG